MISHSCVNQSFAFQFLPVSAHPLSGCRSAASGEIPSQRFNRQRRKRSIHQSPCRRRERSRRRSRQDVPPQAPAILERAAVGMADVPPAVRDQAHERRLTAASNLAIAAARGRGGGAGSFSATPASRCDLRGIASCPTCGFPPVAGRRVDSQPASRDDAPPREEFEDDAAVPTAQTRQHRSNSSAYMKNSRSNPPIRRNTSASINSEQPPAMNISRGAERSDWFEVKPKISKPPTPVD